MHAVRSQLGLGRLLPLGGAGDGAWIVEGAAAGVLRDAARGVRGVRLGALRLAPADPEGGAEPVVPAPPSALPPGPLRVTADVAAGPSEPLPAAAARLRTALAAAAAGRLGLTVTEIDLRVTALLDEDGADGPQHDEAGTPEPVRAGTATTGDDEARVAAAVLSVPGVTGLTGAFGGVGRAVHIEEHGEAIALPHRHARVEIAVSADHRALDVAREVRAAASAALPDHPTVAVLVTAVS